MSTWTREEQERHRAEVRLVIPIPQHNDDFGALKFANQKWRMDAECAGMDVNLFFPDPTNIADKHMALEVCGQCPVRLECLEDELVRPSHEQNGIRGRMTAAERKQLIIERAEGQAA